MNRLGFASFTLVLVAALGNTGCSYHHRYYARYGHGPCHMRARMYAPPAPPEAPAPPEVAAPPAVPAGPRPIIVHANVPWTTVIVINPAPGAPPVVQAVPAPQRQVAPPQSPQPPQPPQQPEGWFEEE